MELDKTSPVIVSANLGQVYLHRLKRRLSLVQILLSFCLAGLGVFSLYWPDNLWLNILLAIIIISGVLLTTGLIRHLIIKHLTLIIDSLFPLSQARHSTQVISFKQAETAILQQIFNLKTAPMLVKPDSITQFQLDALDGAQFGLISFNTNLQPTYANKFAKQLLDIQSNLALDFTGQPSLIDWIKQAQAQKIDDHYVWQPVAYLDPSSGERYWFNLTADFHKSAANETLVLITPADEPAKTQQAFDFIAYAAHELRGPITIIRGYLDILQADFPSKTDTGQIIMDRLTVAGNRLSSYINNILNVAKFDQKSFKLNPKPTAPTSVIDEIYDDIQLRAKTSQKQLTIEIEPDLPILPLDRTSLTQAITNLVDNAIKYSKSDDNIVIRVFRDNSEISFQVADQGIGMPSSVVNNLFKRFYRSQRTQNQVGGTGIGLFITKAIVDAHHGNITVSSEVNKGSTFTINLPIDPDQASSPSGFIRNHGLVRK